MSGKAQARAASWYLMLSKGGRRLETFPLREGASSIGRDATNPIPLPDSSVSRQHAEITVGTDGVTIRDLSSRNGVRVNGVPRQRAHLQPGDKVAICDFVLELATAPPAETSTVARESGLAVALRVDQTVDQRIRLPEGRPDRDLAALYHACFWVAEGLEDRVFTDRCLHLLLEALRACEVQLYSASLDLTSAVSDSNAGPEFKLAAFLAKRFQGEAEAVCVSGRDIARHQRGAGDFNYLVCPVKSGKNGETPGPFVVALRPADLQDFTADDRVLLQAVCQLWARGQAKTRQMTQLREENAHLKEKAGSPATLGLSPAMQKLEAQARKAAATNATVLVLGETGSGKEVLAQFLHDQSARHRGPLVKMNCAAIPDSLIESELFGYAKGAFSGAVRDYNGKFAQAHGGTLFLDEIGEMPLLVQAKVLRAIENREVTPLGSEATQCVDLRLVAATNQDLRDLVQDKRFREDLYYRLDVQTLRVPPLREHAEDIEPLARQFLRRFCAENGLAEMDLAPEAIAALHQHAWPGNIRELSNVIQRCALAAEGLIITAADVAEQLRHSRGGRGN